MSRRAELVAALGASGLTLARTMAAVDALEADIPADRCVTVGLSSNVSLDLLSLFVRKHAALGGMRAQIVMGHHDDPVGDATRLRERHAQGLVLVQFFDNLLPAFEQQLPLLEPAQIAAKEAELRARWRLTFDRAAALPFVHVVAFHRFARAVDSGQGVEGDVVHDTIGRFNAALREEAAAFPNVRVLDGSAVAASIGLAAAFDPRFYYRSTAPYTPAYLDELARHVAAASRSFSSDYRKVLVLDCDNTLWGGIVGEDLPSGIQLDPYSHPGKIFWAMQHELLALERQGVLLCLCSKNNPQDVDEVLSRHPHAVLRREHLAVRKVDWNDKVSNLQAMARELNLGLDSFVFLDDSDFECTAVREALPSVRVFQVPRALSDYPRVMHDIKSLFLAGGVSAESRSKTQQYRQLQQAAAESARFATHEEYLASLGLQVELERDARQHLERISELTFKSNQFNLTTLRQTPGEILQRMDAADMTVYSLTVGDRFGSAGLTGVLLVRWTTDTAHVDAFLMSCRVIGRGIEFSPWAQIARDAIVRGCRAIEACYRPSAKNAQVADFYDRLGLPQADEVDGVRRYRGLLATFEPPSTDWIRITHVE